MPGGEDAKVRIGGDEKPLLAALTKSLDDLRNWGKGASDAVTMPQTGIKALGGALEGLAAPIRGITSLFAGLMAIAGGAAFAAGIEESKKLTGEAMKMAGALGIASDEASALNTALGDIGTDSETYVGAFNHFAKALKANEDQFRAMGLETRDGNKQLRDSKTLFMEALSEVKQYKGGLDQTTAAMTFFGKGVDDVRKLMKLSDAGIEEARKKNEELGLTITENNVVATKKYKAAINDLGDVMSALKKVVGDAVMPIFTKFGQWLSDTGPAAVRVMRTTMALLVGTFETLRLTVVSAWDVLMAFGKSVVELDNFLAGAFNAIKRGDFSGVERAWDAATERIGIVWRKTFLGIKTDLEDTGERLDRIIQGDNSPGATVASGNRRMGSFAPPGKAESKMPLLDEDLNNLKLHQQKVNLQNEQFYEFSKAREAAYWKDVLTTHTLSDEDRRKVLKKYVEAASEAQKKEFEGKLAGMRAEEASYANNYRVRLEYVQREAALIAKAYGDESKEAQDAKRKVIETERQHQQQLLQLKLDALKQYEEQRLGAIDIEHMVYKANADLAGQNINEVLEKEIEFEQRRLDIKRQYALAALDSVDPERDPVKYEQMKAQILAIEQQFEAKRAELQIEAQTKLNQPVMTIYSSIESSMNASLKGILNGTKGFAQSMKSVFASVGDVMIEELITKPLALMAVKWLKERMYAVMGITAKAAEAGAGAAASVASIPVYGWAAALPTMASVFAGVAGIASSVPSASMGYDIPAGVNPLTQLHQREMVLPADIAERFRGGGKGAGGDSIALHVHTPDADGARRFLMDNKEALAAALKDAWRNGVR